MAKGPKKPPANGGTDPPSLARPRRTRKVSKETDQKTVGTIPAATNAAAAERGAIVRTNYVDTEQDVVNVDVNDLEDFKKDSAEEFWQFVIGEFLIAGGFWSAIQRYYALPDGAKAWEDTQLALYVLAIFAGGVIGFFGLQLHRRRQKKIDRIISKAKAAIEERNRERNQATL